MKVCGIVIFLLSVASTLYPEENTCDSQTVLVNAHDKQGFFIRGLKAENFRASIRGKDAPVATIKPGPGPSRVVIAIDVSGSMTEVLKRQIARYTTAELVHSLQGDPQFALVLFGTHVLGTMPFGHSRQEIMAGIDYAVNGFPVPLKERGSAIRDGLLHASDLLSPSQTGDVVVLASDGEENDSKTSDRKLRETFRAKGIRLFVFKLPPDHYLATPQEQNSVYEWLGLAKATGGSVAQLQDADGPRMFVATHNIEDQIANYYLLQLAPPKTMDKEEELKLELIDTDGQRRRDAEILFPNKLLPCTKSLAQRE